MMGAASSRPHPHLACEQFGSYVARMKRFAVGILLAWHCVLSAESYRPVILMHGIFASYHTMEDLESLIKSAHPGTDVYNVDAFNDLLTISPQDSLKDMLTQLHGVQKIVAPIIANATDGVNLICYSQGGLLCRGFLEAYSDHNVRTFVSLSSPQAGQFGDTEYVKHILPNATRDFVYLFCYTDVGQYVSMCNYWNGKELIVIFGYSHNIDPLHQDRYQEFSNFLYPLDTPSPDQGYKSNFEQLEDLVLIGGPDDGVITPWQSSHFAFYDENLEVQEYNAQQFYKDDAFGLKTLDESGRVHVYEIAGVQHVNWHGNKTVFDCCIEPWLK